MFDVPFIVISKITWPWAPVIANHYSTATWLHVSLLLKVEQCVTMGARVSTPSSCDITLMLLAGGEGRRGQGLKGGSVAERLSESLEVDPASCKPCKRSS